MCVAASTVPGFLALLSFENRNSAITETHTFSPQTINQSRFGLYRNAGQGPAGGTLIDQDVGINSSNGTQKGLPVLQALEQVKGVIGGRNGAAARLGLPRTTLIARMRRLGISPAQQSPALERAAAQGA